MYPRRIIIRVVTAPIGAASTRGPIRVRRNIQRLLALAFAFAISSAAAQGQLNIICSVQLPWCEAVVTQFQKDTGIKILTATTEEALREASLRVEFALE